MTLTRRSLLAAPLVLAASRLRADARPYDVALVLATDVSNSIDDTEYEIQRQGIVSALTHRNMMLLLEQGRRYIFQYMEWSSEWTHAFSNWMPIESEDDALAMASLIYGWERSSRGGSTDISEALKAAQASLSAAPAPALRKVIDISFDGRESGGFGSLRPTADAIASAGTIINGLVLREYEAPGDTETLEDYFKTHIAGPQSFSVLVPEPAHFGQMFLRKLLQEVS